jgi:hypothetical protein
MGAGKDQGSVSRLHSGHKGLDCCVEAIQARVLEQSGAEAMAAQQGADVLCIMGGVQQGGRMRVVGNAYAEGVVGASGACKRRDARGGRGKT